MLSISRALRTYLIQKRKFDIVVLNGVFNPKNYFLSRILRRVGCPYVIAAHTDYSDPLFESNPIQKYAFWHLFEKRMLSEALCIQLLAPTHREVLRRRGIDTLVFSSPNGISDQYFENLSEPNWSSDGPVQLIFFGRLDSYTKGLDLLLAAFSIVRRHVEAHLTLMGPDSGDSRVLKKLTNRLKLEQSVTFKDPVYDVNPVEILSAYDLFVMPSRREGFGLAGLEAMLAARPVLVTVEAGLAKSVENSGCGVTVKPDVESISDGILDLILRRKDWPCMGTSARSLVKNKYKWPRIADAVLSEYERALSMKSSLSESIQDMLVI
jgi:glycosyltransferase involved in cell wall biosynthesis